MINDRQELRPIDVAALTQGAAVPSSRFRIRQYIGALADEGIRVAEYCPPLTQHVSLPGRWGRMRRRYLLPVAAAQLVANSVLRTPHLLASRKADLVWVSRNVVPGFDELIGLAGRPRVLDVDDAIWITDPRGEGNAARLARHVDAVVAGNTYLAEWYSRHNCNVVVVPTAVDCEIVRPAAIGGERTDFVVGWMGTTGNHRYVEEIRPALERLLKSFPHARILLVSDTAPQWWAPGDPRWEFRAWDASRELADLQDMSVGLMPLAYSEWTRGKCSFKMLQAMAAGLPVVVSPVGMNVEVLGKGDCGLAASTESEWYDALSRLASDPNGAQDLGRTGRLIVEAHYSVGVVASRLAESFRRWI